MTVIMADIHAGASDETRKVAEDPFRDILLREIAAPHPVAQISATARQTHKSSSPLPNQVCRPYNGRIIYFFSSCLIAALDNRDLPRIRGGAMPRAHFWMVTNGFRIPARLQNHIG